MNFSFLFFLKINISTSSDKNGFCHAVRAQETCPLRGLLSLYLDIFGIFGIYMCQKYLSREGEKEKKKKKKKKKERERGP